MDPDGNDLVGFHTQTGLTVIVAQRQIQLNIGHSNVEQLGYIYALALKTHMLIMK